MAKAAAVPAALALIGAAACLTPQPAPAVYLPYDGAEAGADAVDDQEASRAPDVTADATAVDASGPSDADAARAPCVSDEACAAALAPGPCQFARCVANPGGSATCQLLSVKDGTPCGAPECLIEGGKPVLQARLCTAGSCAAAATTVACSDGDACTTDLCLAATGCAHSFIDCADGNPCSADSCAAATGCVHSPLDASPCDDGNPCTSGDHCNESNCTGGASKVCPPAGPCAAVSCDPVSGHCLAAPAAAGAPCDDGDPCTNASACQGVVCKGTGNACDDGDVCTTDGCAGGGCQNGPQIGPCDLDQSLCTADQCSGGVCKAGPAAVCDDGNPCTADSCAAATGCSHLAAPFATPCGAAKWCGLGSAKAQCVAVVAPAGMVFVPGAVVELGCNAAVDAACAPNEKPAHKVALASFFIDQAEVTVAQYQACVNGGACTAPATGAQATWGQAGKSQHPVNHVAWGQAATYCLWAGGGRLCSEAEWEYAARGSDGRRYPWGNQVPIGCDLATWGGGCGGIQAVGQLPKGKSPFGALDMAGNVREWVADWYSGATYADLALAATPVSGPTGPKTGSERVVRGGYFQDGAPELRTSARAFATPATAAFSLGIRCCRTPK